MTVTVVPGNTTQSARRARYAARDALWDWSSLARVRGCGRSASAIGTAQGWEARSVAKPVGRLPIQAPGSRVRVHQGSGYGGGVIAVDPVVHVVRKRDAEGNVRAAFNGVQSCGSVWACPVCAHKIQTHRQAEVNAALDRAEALGWRVAFTTHTVRHSAGQPLAAVWGAVSGAWRAAVSGSRQWRADRERWGIQGYLRLVEVTHGRNGWHVHVHSLVFFTRADGDRWALAAEQIGQRMQARWTKALTGTPFRPGSRHGGDSRLLVSRDRLAAYFTKGLYDVKGFGSAASEVTSGSKVARSGNVTPFGLLARIVSAGDADDLARWWEWETVSRGRRQLLWSNGLRAQLLPEPEADDEDLADADEPGQVLARIPGPAFARMVRTPGLAAAVLEAAEVDDDGQSLAALLGPRYLWGPPDS
jgi:hypothetical protein